MTTVMACIDGSASAPAVCDYAAWAALRMNAPLTLLHVLDRSRYPGAGDLSGNIGLGSREQLLEELASLDEKRSRLALEQGRLMLEEVRARVLADGITTPAVRQRHGDLVDTLAELADDIRLLVLGKLGEDHMVTSEHLLGSHLERVIRTLHHPILITPPTYREPGNFMFAFDGSDTGRKGVELVAYGQLFQGLPCHLVMVSPDRADMREHLAWAEQVLAGSGYQVKATLLDGEVEPALRTYVQTHEIDLMIMGAYGHSRIRQWLVGSTTTETIRNATQPLLILR